MHPLRIHSQHECGTFTALFLLSQWLPANLKAEWLTALATLAVGWYTLTLQRSTKRLWLESRAAGRIAEETLVATNRSWILQELEIADALKVDANAVRFSILTKVTNIGSSPAINVQHLVIAVHYGSLSPVDVDSYLRQNLPFLFAVDGSFMRGGTLFPGQVDGIVSQFGTPLNGDIALGRLFHLLGIATYEFTFGPRVKRYTAVTATVVCLAGLNGAKEIGMEGLRLMSERTYVG